MATTQEIVERINVAVRELSLHLTRHPSDVPEAFGSRATLVFHAPNVGTDIERRLAERDTVYFQRSTIFEERVVLEGEKDAEGNFKDLIPGWAVTCVLNVESPTDTKELDDASISMMEDVPKAT